MAGKRSATSELNHENWDHEEDTEDSGIFQKAPEDVISRRVIKTARRRGIGTASTATAGEDGDKKNVFGGFTAFAKPAATPSSAFGFLNNHTNDTGKKTETKPIAPSFAFLNKPATSGSAAVPAASATETKSTTPITKLDDKPVPTFSFLNNSPKSSKSENKTPKKLNVNGDLKKDDQFMAKLKGLNESVAGWIKKHVDENPFVCLYPIFRDYEKYYAEIEKSRPVSEEVKKELASFSFKPPPPQPANKESMNSDKKTEAPKFSFGIPTTSATNAPIFGFGATISSTSPTTTMTSTFSFGGGNSTSKPFAFTNVSQPPQADNQPIEEDYEELPPTVVFTPVVEENSLYSIRCKVFVKKDNSFGDHGVGNLFLKSVPDSEKVQLIVRADTNLGNLLCNFILSAGIPTKRMGKKDVMLVCLPMPDSKPPPVPILLRVKGPEEADGLLKILEKHKK